MTPEEWKTMKPEIYWDAFSEKWRTQYIVDKPEGRTLQVYLSKRKRAVDEHLEDNRTKILPFVIDHDRGL